MTADRPHGMTRDALADALRAWDGLDDPHGPDAQADRAAGAPQPSRPSPGWGAPNLGHGWRTPAWDDVHHHANRAFGEA